MPIYVGSTEILAGQLKVDGTDVTAVYLGAFQIWPVTVPSEGDTRVTESGTDTRVLEDGT